MKSIVAPRARYLVVSSVVAASAVALLLVHPGVDVVDVRAQSAMPDRWVATWTTAEVGRPQNPAPPLSPVLQPFMTNTGARHLPRRQLHRRQDRRSRRRHSSI